MDSEKGFLEFGWEWLAMSRLAGLMKEKNVSYAELSEILDIPESDIRDIGWGIGQLNMNSLRKLCDYFGCTIDYLLDRLPRYNLPLSKKDYKFIEAYRAASERDKKIVDTILEEYMD